MFIAYLYSIRFSHWNISNPKYSQYSLSTISAQLALFAVFLLTGIFLLAQQIFRPAENEVLRLSGFSSFST